MNRLRGVKYLLIGVFYFIVQRNNLVENTAPSAIELQKLSSSTVSESILNEIIKKKNHCSSYKIPLKIPNIDKLTRFDNTASEDDILQQCQSKLNEIVLFFKCKNFIII